MVSFWHFQKKKQTTRVVVVFNILFSEESALGFSVFGWDKEETKPAEGNTKQLDEKKLGKPKTYPPSCAL